MAALVVALALAVLVSACGSAPLGREAASGRPPTSTASSAPASPSPVTAAPDPQDPGAAFGLPPWSTVVATAIPPTVAVYPAPGSAVSSSSFSNPNEMRVPLVFRVTAVSGDWLQVMLPQRPNGSTGWVRTEDVSLGIDDYQVVVHLDSHTLTVAKGGQEVEVHPIISGMPAAPTPTGDFYITELLVVPDPSGPYGPYAFGLSDFSDTYSEFEGGPGQIAIHGTNEPYLMGRSASHGCVRLTNDVIAHLATFLPVGTPVFIVQ